MALDVKTGTFNIGTGSSKAVTGVGFTPKVIFFFWNGRTATAAGGRATHLRGFGFTCGTSSNFCVPSRSADAQGAAQADGGHSDDYCIAEMSDGSTVVGTAVLASFDAGGFTLTCSDTFTTDLLIGYLAIGGSALENVAALARLSSVSTGDQSITGFGFQGNAVLVIPSGRSGSTPTSLGVDSSIGIGAATATGQEWCFYGGSNDAATTMNTASYGYPTLVGRFTSGDVTAVGQRGVLKSFDSDGFTITWAETTGTYLIYIVMKIASGYVKAGTLNTRTDGNNIAVTGLTFVPKAVLFASHCKAQSTEDTVQAHHDFSVGAATGASARCANSITDRDNEADSIVLTSFVDDAVYVRLDSTGTVGKMDLVSLDSSGGFTCVMDDTDPDAALVGYLAFGDTASGGAAVPSRLVSPTPLKSLVNGGLLRASLDDVRRFGRPGLVPA